LRRARLVEAEKRGLFVVYRLANSEVSALWRTLRDVGASQLAEVDRLVETYLTDRETLAAVSKEDLVRQIAEGAILVLDVRPSVEFEQGHIVGARSIPIDELERRLTELPRDQEIVAYCRGPYCVFADEAVSLLLERGYLARRLTEGLPEWRAAGYPVEPAAAAS
jgi:ArsR family transcriptional regulator